jgi:glucokinase
LLAEKLEQYPDYDLAKSPLSMKERTFSLRGLAQEIFDFQAKAPGIHVANLAMALDQKFIVLGGGLMDPEATTNEFRENYLNILRAAAHNYFWPTQKKAITIIPAALGDLSQAIGAALTALYRARA